MKSSPEKLNTIFNNCQEGIWEIDPKGITLSVNQRLLTYFGYGDPNQMVGRSFFEFIPEDGQEGAKSRLEQRANGQSETHEFLFHTHTGEELWLTIAASPIFENGKVSSIIAFCSDITQIKFQNVISNSIQKMASIGGWELDLQSEKCMWTDEVYRIYGIPLGTPADRTLGLSFYLPHEQSRLQVQLNSAVEGKSFRDTFEFVDAHGNHKFVEAMGEPVFNKYGHVYKIRGTFQDISLYEHSQRANALLNQRYSKLLDMAPVGIFETDPHGNCTFVNSSWTTLSGLTFEKAQKTGWTSAVHPDDLTRVLTVWSRSIASEDEFELSFRYLRPDGHVSYVHCRTRKIKDSSGTVQSYLGCFQDFTDSQAKQIEIEQTLATISQFALVGEIDTSGKIVDVNKAICDVSGFHREELIGRDFTALASSHFMGSEAKPVWQTIQSGKIWTGLLENHTKQGFSYFVKSVIAPITDGNHRIKKYLIVQTDITEQLEANRQLQNAQSITKTGSFFYDVLNHSLKWSKELYKIFDADPNLTSEELFSIYNQRVHPEDQPRLRALIEESLQQGKGYEVHHRILLPSGQIRYIHGVVKVLLKNGVVRSIQGTAQDVTESILRENQLKEMVEFNSAILKSANFSIITADLNGVITGFNAESERILGYCADEVIGKITVRSLHDPDEMDELSSAIERELNASLPLGLDEILRNVHKTGFDERRWTYIGKNGRRTPVILNVTELRDHQNHVYGYMGIAKDISKEIELEQNLATQKAMALHNAKLASLGELAAGVAHEINNPLAIVSMNLDLLEKFKDNPDIFKKKIQTLKNATERIAKIVKGLKKFSRSGDTGVDYVLASLPDIIDDALVILEPRAKNHSVRIGLKLAHTPRIKCDPLEIEQVIINLLNNAIDAVKDRQDRWILIEWKMDSPYLLLRITDSGNGIAPGIVEKLFQPFVTTKPVGEGTGLGLSICKGILSDHKATIQINSRSSNTCFEIRFTQFEEFYAIKDGHSACL